MSFSDMTWKIVKEKSEGRYSAFLTENPDSNVCLESVWLEDQLLHQEEFPSSHLGGGDRQTYLQAVLNSIIVRRTRQLVASSELDYDKRRLHSIVEAVRILEMKNGNSASRIAFVSYNPTIQQNLDLDQSENPVIDKISISEAVLLSALQNEEKTLRKSIAARLRAEADTIEDRGA